MLSRRAVGNFKISSEPPSNRDGVPGSIIIVETGGSENTMRLYVRGDEVWFYIDLEVT